MVSEIKLTDWFYGSPFPTGLVAYYKGNEASGSLIDTMGNFDLPIVGSGSVGGDGDSRGSFCSANAVGAVNPTPSSFCLLNSAKPLDLLDTNVHPKFIWEAVVNTTNMGNDTSPCVILKIPRTHGLTVTKYLNNCYFSVNNNLGDFPYIPYLYNLSLGWHYVVVASSGVGVTNGTRVYVDKVLQQTSQGTDFTLAASIQSVDNLCVGGDTDSTAATTVRLGLDTCRVKEIAIYNDMTSYTDVEALMAKRMKTADASVITSYPL